MNGAKSRKRHLKLKNPGFALVISLSLMVLLTVLAVGLLSLSTISLRASSREDAMATARANARMALMLAIGELQKQAGPDQRTTGTADLAGTAAGDPLAAGTAPLNNTSLTSVSKGLTMVQPGTRYWTGVWNQTAATTQIFTRTPSPNHKAWLISGNEGLKAGSRLTPASTIASIGGSGDVSDPTKAVVLVGKNTVGTSDPGRYVGAPLVQIGAPKKNGKQPDQPAGRHGWWIGDEGVKARFNQVPEDNPGQAMTYESMGDRRAGWEAVDGFSDYPNPGSGNVKAVASVITLPESRLLNPAFGEPGTSDSPMQRNFHAATADSWGLLVDNFNGGLRVDMTPYLNDGFPTGIATTNIIPRTIASRMRAPSWNRIKEFADLYKNMEGGSLVVKAGTGDFSTSIAPIITELRILLGARMVPAGGTSGADAFKIHPCVKVGVALANPYPYPLKWNAPLQLELSNGQLNDGIDGNYQPACIYRGAKDPSGNKPVYVSKTGGQPSVLYNAVFQIASGELPAGEAKAYTIGTNVLRPAGSTARVIVDLKPFHSSSPGNFDNCLELAHDGVNNLATALDLDVREDWTTTQVTAELRSGTGSNTLLRRLERFELDNGFFQETTRNMTSATARAMTRPFPLHYYCFQYSQPGNDYRQLLPGGAMGLRSSTVRSFADFNPQAKRFQKSIASYNPPPYFMESADSLSKLPFGGQGGQTGDAFTKNLIVTPVAWGSTPLATKKVILFTPQEKFVSLAQLQHADLTGDDNFGSVGHQPGNAFGNSYATPYVKRSMSIQNRTNYTFLGTNNAGAFSPVPTNFYDLSYLLNTALWDSYYLSAIPRSGAAIPESPAVAKIHPSLDSPDLRDAKLAAKHLIIDGAFNVNSTSKEAWKALLAGSKHLKHPADTGSSGDALYPRSLKQTSPASVPPSGETEDSYAGFRRLTDAQLDAIALEMTRQVRMRGPFVSLAQFVNRALADIEAGAGSQAEVRRKLTRSGAIQSALDEGGANINMAGTKNIFRDITVADDRVRLQANGSSTRADLDGTDSMNYNEAVPGDIPKQSKDLNPGAMASIIADRTMLTGAQTVRNEQGWRSTGIPGWITQADILQVIGPSLAARSDTFRVRAYGEAVDPETGKPLARAWCEAIVQRTPEYIDQHDAPNEVNADLEIVNKTFGRRFETVSFKWLSNDEI